jgi:drug/metabolite transporter (DMT)-like permease
MRLDPRTARVVGLAALSDVVLGVVLLVLGTEGDNPALQWAGVVLALLGGVVLAVVMLLRDRPGAPGST